MKKPRFNKSFKQVRSSFRREVRFHLGEGWGVEDIAMAAEVDVDVIRAMVREMRAAGELAGMVPDLGESRAPGKGGNATVGGETNLTETKGSVNDA